MRMFMLKGVDQAAGMFCRKHSKGNRRTPSRSLRASGFSKQDAYGGGCATTSHLGSRPDDARNDSHTCTTGCQSGGLTRHRDACLVTYRADEFERSHGQQRGPGLTLPQASAGSQRSGVLDVAVGCAVRAGRAGSMRKRRSSLRHSAAGAVAPSFPSSRRPLHAWHLLPCFPSYLHALCPLNPPAAPLLPVRPLRETPPQ